MIVAASPTQCLPHALTGVILKGRASHARDSGKTSAPLDGQLLEHRVDRDDVALELELRVGQARGNPDELREVQDRHREVPARLLLQLRLPRIQGEVTQRAWRHHRVGTRLHRLLDRLDQLGERRLLAGLDDREAAAL